jgi:hypothetical protein
LRAAKAIDESGKSNAFVTSMEINYLLPGKGKIDIVVEELMTLGAGGIESRLDYRLNNASVQAERLRKELETANTHVLEGLFEDKDVTPAGTHRQQAESKPMTGSYRQAIYGILLKDGSKGKNKGGDRVYADCKAVVLSIN